MGKKEQRDDDDDVTDKNVKDESSNSCLHQCIACGVVFSCGKDKDVKECGSKFEVRKCERCLYYFVEFETFAHSF